MSGGALDYVYTRLEGLEYQMHDTVMNYLIIDIQKVLHDLEWALSDDISMDDYYKTVKNFKKKWFKDTKETINMLLDCRLEEIKRELYRDFGYFEKKEEDKNAEVKH